MRTDAPSPGSRAAACAPAVALVLLALAAPAGAQDPPQPRNTSAPTVSGGEPRQEGQTLTAGPGGWTTYPQSTISYQYEWQRCRASCVAIPGANGSSYRLGQPDVGARVRVRVDANCNVPVACTQSSAYSAQTGTVLPDPHTEGVPLISGLTREREVLVVNAGFWRSVGDLSFAYQWLRCDRAGANCSNVGGATSSAYRLTAADAGATLRAAVTARSSRGGEATALSPQTGRVGRASALRPGPRLLSPFPSVVVAGVVDGDRVRLTEFTVRGPRGATLTVRCKGRGCPLRRRRQRLRGRRTRVRRLQKSLAPGLRIEVRVTRRGFIGKYTRLRIRSGRVPARVDRCVYPGSRRPRRCPR